MVRKSGSGSTRWANIEAPPCACGTRLRHVLVAHADRRETWTFRTPAGTVRDFAFEPDVVRTMLIGGASIGMLPNFHAAGPIAEGALARVLPNYACGAVDAHALYPRASDH